MIVADANILAAFYLSTRHSQDVVKVFTQDPCWCVPALWRSEFRSVLFQFIKQKFITITEAIEIFAAAEDFLKSQEYEISSLEVFKVFEIAPCSAYDAEYLALSRSLGVPLITLDKELLKKFSTHAMTPERFFTLGGSKI